MMRVVAFVLAVAISFGSTAADENPASMPAIVILGDSLSAAYGMQLHESWPSLLQSRLEEHGYAHRVFNSSITGDTTQGGRTRLPRLLDKHNPDVVVIELGGNDGLRGLPLEVTRDNLAWMVRAAQEQGARVVLAEMRIPPNYGAAYTEQFTAAYGELASETGAVLLPFVLEEIALAEGMMQADGIHPAAAAQPLIMEKFWGAILPLLGDPG
jgi:acyl-CoA thioesterase-1